MHKKTVLVAPLDWGIGHATRCIPLIEELLKNNCTVIIAANSRGKWLLQNEFPNHLFLDLPAYRIRYHPNLPVWLSVILQIPKILKIKKREHQWLDNQIQDLKLDLVISDNRPGLYNKKIPSIYITHQVQIKAFKLFEPFLNYLHQRVISRFTYCWIPDFENKNESIAGELSHATSLPKNAMFIDPLSRFKKFKNETINQNLNFDILVILSGTEPLRQTLEDLILMQAQKCKQNFVIVRGVTESIKKRKLSPNIELIDSLSPQLLFEYIMAAKKIVCRSGYSTIMDLVCLEKTAFLIPTPGQTEQEYLAKYLSGRGFRWSSEKEFQLKVAID